LISKSYSDDLLSGHVVLATIKTHFPMQCP
jgi:hypothetical protein